MKTETFKGRDFLAETDFTREEIETILQVAEDLKRERAKGQHHDDLLRGKTLFMIFYNKSLRTRNSFEAGMTQLGGHAHYLDPEKIYAPTLEGREVAYSTERVSDVARVLDRMGDAIAIRCYGDPVNWEYGGAHKMLREFARWADIPVLNMEDDIYHPFHQYGMRQVPSLPGPGRYTHCQGKIRRFPGSQFHYVLGVFSQRSQTARCATFCYPVCHNDGYECYLSTPSRDGT